MGNKAGIVLAGGRSSRMRCNKALLDYNGQKLIDHMIGLLQKSGFEDVYVSGDIKGYSCLPDTTPYAGPAHAMRNIMAALPQAAGLFFVPVDMPLLPAFVIDDLCSNPDGAYLESWPLPAWITPPYDSAGQASSVQGLLAEQGIYPQPLPAEYESFMINANTPAEWQKVRRA